jgi:uncharacterized membrane protein SirB2
MGPNDKVSHMSTTLLYAFIMAIAQIVVTLISYFLGYQTDKMSSGSWFQIVPLVVSIVILTLGIRAVREEQPGKYMTYGKGLSTGILIALFSSVIGAIYAYIHFTYVNPGFPDYLIETSRVKWAAAGMSESKMEGAEKGVRWFTRPAIQSIFSLVIGFIFGLILSLIISAFLKRTPPNESKVSA